MPHTVSLKEYPYELVCREIQAYKRICFVLDGRVPDDEMIGCGATILYLKTIAPGTALIQNICTWPDRPARNADKLRCLRCQRVPLMVSVNFRKRMPGNAENIDGSTERYEGFCPKCKAEGWLNWRNCQTCHDQQETFLAEEVADGKLNEAQDA